MQSLVSRVSVPVRLESRTGHVIQIRNHVKKYPWRISRETRETYLDSSEKPYTDKLNMNEFHIGRKKLKPWMKVIPKEKDNRFNSFKWNDSYRSDPKEAQQTAESRWESFARSVIDRGSARESKPYSPPDINTVREQVIGFCKNILFEADQQSVSATDDILDLDLNQNLEMKFNLILRCIEEFDHHLPTPYLNDIATLGQLIEYFSTPVRGADPYTTLVRKTNELPPNLSLISESHRFNKENDQLFGGYSAYPGIISVVSGLRGKKKYPTLNQDEFQWPDI